MMLSQNFTKDELAAVTGEVLARAKMMSSDGAVVIALQGDLGAGKTTFVQMLGKHLGVVEGITSPTFTVMKGYETTDERFQHLIHMDAYRIEDESELAPLHFEDILAATHTLFCIEWPEKVAASLPQNILSVKLSVIDENTRHIEID